MFDDVVRSWDRWQASPGAGRTLARWVARHPELAGWTWPELRSPRCSARTDTMQAALVAVAQAGDGAAVRTLVVQVRPGLSGVAWRAFHRHRCGPRPYASVQEAEADVLSAFGETVARHPLDRRPARLAANLLLDTHQRLWRASGRAERMAAAERQGPAGTDGYACGPPEMVDGALDLAAAIACAFDRMAGTGPSRQLNAEVAYRAWILDEPSVAIARHLGLERKAVDTRLCRLRSAIRGAQATLDAEAALAEPPGNGPNGRAGRPGNGPNGRPGRPGSGPNGGGGRYGAGQARPAPKGRPAVAARSASRAATSGLCSS